MPICFRKQLDSDTSIAIWKIEESIDALRDKFALNQEDQAIFKSFSLENRKRQWLSARVLLNEMLPAEGVVHLQKDVHGKPYIDKFPYFISISHCDGYAAVALSKNKPIGIDIEPIKPNRIVPLVGKFLSSRERAFVDSIGPEPHLYACWSIKEAVFKCYGQRGVSLLSDIELEDFIYQVNGQTNACLTKDHMKYIFEAFYQEFEGNMLAYVLSAS